MATLTRSITNASSTDPLKVIIDGYDPTGAVTLAPSATLDLLTVIPVEALHSMQAELANLVTAGFVTVAASIDSSALYNGAVLAYLALISPDTKIVFNPTSAGPVDEDLGVDIAVQVENASSIVDPFVSPVTVTVVAISTSTGTPKLNGLLAAASPLTISGTLATSTYTVSDSTGWTDGDTITQGAATTTQASHTPTTIVLTSNVGFATGTITNTSVVAATVSTAAGVASVHVSSVTGGTTNLVIAQPSVSLTHSSTCAVTLS